MKKSLLVLSFNAMSLATCRAPTRDALFDGGREVHSVTDLCAHFRVPYFPVEPGHVMSKESYERMVRAQQK